MSGAKWLTVRKIGDKFGPTREQTHAFFKRYNKKQQKITEGKSVKMRGGPSNYQGEFPPSIQRLDKLSQMRYVMSNKDRYIKRLEMEIELAEKFFSNSKNRVF